MNGAGRLCEVLLANRVDVCFANPGTSEMHFTAALDSNASIRAQRWDIVVVRFWIVWGCTARAASRSGQQANEAGRR